MKNYFYYKSFRRTIIQFLDAFNDIRIARFDDNGLVTKYIKVPLKLMPKEKVMFYLYKKDQSGRPAKDLRMPMMGATLTGVEFASDRMTNKHEILTMSRTPSAGTTQGFPNPTPYNLEFQISIYARNTSDIDQILEQILPYFAPHIFIRIDIPEIGTNFEIKVIFNSCSPDRPIEMDESTYRIEKWDLNFTVHAYLFKPITDQKIVNRFIQRTYTESVPWLNRENEVSFAAGKGGLETGSISLSASGYSQTTRKVIDDDGNVSTEVSDSPIGSDRDVYKDDSDKQDKIVDKYGNEIDYNKNTGYGTNKYSGDVGDTIIDRDTGNKLEGAGVIPNTKSHISSLTGAAASGAIDKDAKILSKYETFVN